jgi:hypothetical protein
MGVAKTTPVRIRGGSLTALGGVMIKLCLSAFIYAIWKEMINIRHGNHLLCEEKILQSIFCEIRARVAAGIGDPHDKSPS